MHCGANYDRHTLHTAASTGPNMAVTLGPATTVTTRRRTGLTPRSVPDERAFDECNRPLLAALSAPIDGDDPCGIQTLDVDAIRQREMPRHRVPSDDPTMSLLE